MSTNELLTPINQAVQKFDRESKSTGDPDEINLIVSFYMSKEKHELTVYPETTIKDVADILNVVEASKFTFINTRTGTQTSKLKTTMAEFDIVNNDLLLINDEGPNA